MPRSPTASWVAWGDTSAGVPPIPAGRHPRRAAPRRTFAVFRAGLRLLPLRLVRHPARRRAEPRLDPLRRAEGAGRPRPPGQRRRQLLRPRPADAVAARPLGRRRRSAAALRALQRGPQLVDIAGATYDYAAPTPLARGACAPPRTDLTTVWSHALSDATWQRTMVHVKSAGCWSSTTRSSSRPPGRCGSCGTSAPTAPTATGVRVAPTRRGPAST